MRRGSSDLSDGRIVGGSSASMRERPYQTFVLLGDYQFPHRFLCGGTIISDMFVLSAAHCTEGQTPGGSSVVTGMSTITTPIPSKNQQPLQNIFDHPDYDSDWLQNDISLIELKCKLTFSETVYPACLPSHDMCLGNLEPVVVSGYGATTERGDKSSGKQLNQVMVPMVSKNNCDLTIYGVNYTVAFCAGGVQGYDSCQGDSGGPLVFQDKNKVATVYGVVSWGYGCARKGYPGVYTRTSNYLQWIEDKTNLNFGNDDDDYAVDTCLSTGPISTYGHVPNDQRKSVANMINSKFYEIRIPSDSNVPGTKWCAVAKKLGGSKYLPIDEENTYLYTESCVDNLKAQWLYNKQTKQISSASWNDNSLCWTFDRQNSDVGIFLRLCDKADRNQKFRHIRKLGFSAIFVWLNADNRPLRFEKNEKIKYLPGFYPKSSKINYKKTKHTNGFILRPNPDSSWIVRATKVKSNALIRIDRRTHTFKAIWKMMIPDENYDADCDCKYFLLRLSSGSPLCASIHDSNQKNIAQSSLQLKKCDLSNVYQRFHLKKFSGSNSSPLSQICNLKNQCVSYHNKKYLTFNDGHSYDNLEIIKGYAKPL